MWTTMLAILGMESCKESAAKRPPRDAGMLRGRDVSVSCGHLEYFKRRRFDLHYAAKSLGNGEFLADQGSHETSETSFALHSRHARHASGMVGWCDGSWADIDEKRRSTTGGLLMLGGACVAGWSRMQKPTALSSGDSEFYSATVCACELLWACEFF